jgi:GIY-YIG catalytic domain
MTGHVTVQEIFNAAGLLPCGPVSWGTPIPERSGGVYLIELGQSKEEDGQSIIYVGRTKRPLRRRMREFYKHRYGKRRPHRGGQTILKFAPSLLVYWATTDACADAEDKMIERFRKLVGRLPYGNRMRSARAFR